MLIKIGHKRIPMDKALSCYKDKALCRKTFGLTNKEYDKLITKMLKAVKAEALSQTQTQPQSQSQQFPVGAYDSGNNGYSTLNNFNQNILPNTYAPINNTRQQAQQFQAQAQAPGPGPGQLADMYELKHKQQVHSDLLDNTQSNKSLMDRRFFQGQQTPASSAIPIQAQTANPIPLRFDDSAANRMIRQQDRALPDVADHKLFSRTFDLAKQQIPDYSMERQAVDSRGTTGIDWYRVGGGR